MKTIWALALIAPLAACATITRGTTQTFTVESDPSGASVETSNGMQCAETPCTFEDVPRNSVFTVTVSMDGYRPSTHTITHQMSGEGTAGIVGNVLIGGIIGVAVDSTSGATQDLTPNPLVVALEPEEAKPEQATAETVGLAIAPAPDAASSAGAASEPAPAAAEAGPAPGN